MTTLQDQYINAVRESQETWTGIVESFSDTLQKTFTLPATSFGVVDPAQAIDQVFDFWGKTLEVQRDVAKQFATVSVEVAEQVRKQAESIGTAVRDQASAAQEAVREQATAAQEAVQEQAAAARAAVREQAAEKYADLTKAELQEELAARDLPKTGNVDELRERLIADDQS